ncbi:MAG: glycosyltransferase family 4 protein [Deltaproteobacteria bacterium]|nr:glycosyltransferase family 4 protein [Deltaproteobacteria bacterium]
MNRSDKRRVGYLLLWFPEPSQTFILDEVNTLADLGLDVRVFTLYGPRPAARVAGMAQVRTPVSRLGIPAAGMLLRELAQAPYRFGRPAAPFLARVLARRWRSLETAGEALWAALAGVHLARRGRAEGLTHFHAPWANGPATAAWVASHLSGIPFSFCAHAHDLYPPDGALTEKLRAARFVRTISEANRRFLTDLAPEAAPKIVKIPYGAPLTATSPASPPPGPPHRLLALGRLVEKKGFPILLEACHLLARDGADFHLTLAGDGPQRRHLLRLIADLGLADRVSLPGFVPHNRVPALFAAAHLFVMPCIIDSRGDRDGLPNVILEALAHAVPVVATPVNGIPEAVRPGETGWLVPAGDAKALARAIREALADPAEARRRARAGQALVAQEFNSRRNYGRLLACLQADAAV